MAYTGGDPINYLDPAGVARINNIGYQTYCGWQGGVLASPGSPWWENGWDNSVWSCQTGTIATVSVKGTAFPKCNPTGDPLKEKNLTFVATHWDDAVDLGQAYKVPGDWIVAWAAYESGSLDANGNGQGWGTIAQAGPNQNNFLGETAGAWANVTTCGPGTIAKYACFGSFYDSVSAAFTVRRHVRHNSHRRIRGGRTGCPGVSTGGGKGLEPKQQLRLRHAKCSANSRRPLGLPADQRVYPMI